MEDQREGYLVITEEDRRKAETHPALGPGYFAARRVVEKSLEPFNDEVIKPFLEETVEKFRDLLRERVQEAFFTSLECGIQNEFWNALDDCVFALITGEKWALERFVTKETHWRSDRICAAILSHASEEVRGKRIAELEKEVERLKKDNERLCGHY